MESNDQRDLEFEKLIKAEIGLRNPETIADVVCYQEVDSVMDLASNSEELDSSLRLILSHSQRKGRGQRGRNWLGGKDSFLGCIVLNLEKTRNFSCFALVIGLVICQQLRKLGIEARVKWPNDVLVGAYGKKISGILIESSSFFEFNRLRVGIGVNLNQYPEGSTSILNELGCYPSLAEFSAELFLNCKQAIEDFKIFGFSYFHKDWSALDYLRDKEITIKAGENIFSGKEVGVDLDGCLQIEIDGNIKKFASGQIQSNFINS